MRIVATVGTLILAAASTLPAPAQARPPAPQPSTALQQALQRDLHLTQAQASVRQAHEAAAMAVEPGVRAALGDRFGGAWYSADAAQLAVGVLTPADAALVQAAGAKPVTVARTERHLAEVKKKLDTVANTATKEVYAWYIDPVANQVVIAAATASSGRRLADAAHLTADAVRLDTTARPFQPVYDIRGGDQYNINGTTLCSIGFSVNNGGFVTAGHCGTAGNPTWGYNNVAQGSFAGSSFPGNDYAWVRTNSSWTPRPWVNDYAGGNVAVAGSAEAPVGSSICRSGRTTGWRCGTVQAKNVTVNYSGSLVYGLTQTSACAEPGDSGGSWMSGNQAQGVTSGAGGNCTTGGTTVFQPVNEILGAYGLSLTTAGGGTSRIIGWQNKCIDVPNSNFADGQRLQLWDCNGTNAQNWTFPGDGTIRTVNNLCMDVAWGSTAAGAAIRIANCSGNPAQQFVLTGANDLVNPQANKCVDVSGWGGTGTPLQQWDCTGGANQKWWRG